LPVPDTFSEKSLRKSFVVDSDFLSKKQKIINFPDIFLKKVYGVSGNFLLIGFEENLLNPREGKEPHPQNIFRWGVAWDFSVISFFFKKNRIFEKICL